MCFYFNYDVNRNMINHKINPSKIKAIILHFNGNNKPWDNESLFKDEWLKNKDIINFRQTPTKRFNEKDFYKEYFLFMIYSLFKKISSFNLKFLCRHILINYYPRIYTFIKNNQLYTNFNSKNNNIKF